MVLQDSPERCTHPILKGAHPILKGVHPILKGALAIVKGSVVNFNVRAKFGRPDIFGYCPTSESEFCLSESIVARTMSA
ncbi:13043_t:CDS:2, partial [Ambispora leptoticha]